MRTGEEKSCRYNTFIFSYQYVKMFIYSIGSIRACWICWWGEDIFNAAYFDDIWSMTTTSTFTAQNYINHENQGAKPDRLTKKIKRQQKSIVIWNKRKIFMLNELIKVTTLDFLRPLSQGIPKSPSEISNSELSLYVSDTNYSSY